jgi:hypothetical protein
MRTAVALVALAGCSFPTKGTPFGCVGHDLPTTAPDMIHVRGSVFDPLANVPVAGAAVSGFVIASDTVIQTINVTTDADGLFTASEMTGGAPHTQFIRSRADGYLDTVAYAAVPVASDVDLPLRQFSQPALDALASITGLTLDPAKALLIVSVVNCNDEPVAGATVTVTTSNPSDVVEVTYFVEAEPSRTATTTDDQLGAALVTGLSPGPVTVHASFGTTPFRTHDVTTTLGALTFAEISP